MGPILEGRSKIASRLQTSSCSAAAVVKGLVSRRGRPLGLRTNEFSVFTSMHAVAGCSPTWKNARDVQVQQITRFVLNQQKTVIDFQHQTHTGHKLLDPPPPLLLMLLKEPDASTHGSSSVISGWCIRPVDSAFRFLPRSSWSSDAYETKLVWNTHPFGSTVA